ncbi:MAG: hypothetical protein II894_08995, partial [Bacteroidales bacterium]|nr:hypothetical protein [Bacteroidales bacterium]
MQISTLESNTRSLLTASLPVKEMVICCAGLASAHNKKREKKSAIEDDNDLKKHEYLLVTDYFTTSRFTLQNLKKKYGTNKVLVL